MPQLLECIKASEQSKYKSKSEKLDCEKKDTARHLSGLGQDSIRVGELTSSTTDMEHEFI